MRLAFISALVKIFSVSHAAADVIADSGSLLRRDVPGKTGKDQRDKIEKEAVWAERIERRDVKKHEHASNSIEGDVKAHANSTHRFEDSALANSSSEGWISASLKTLEYELNIENNEKAGTKSKVRLALLGQFFFFGMLGFDRCFMGQFWLGVVKCLTGGGFFVWAALDYIVLMINMAQKSKSIDMLGFKASFGDGTEIDDAFYLTLILLFFSASFLYGSYMYATSEKGDGTDEAGTGEGDPDATKDGAAADGATADAGTAKEGGDDAPK